MENEIINLCKDIKLNSVCSCCGASRFNNHNCLYCGNENVKLKELVNKLVDVLNKDAILDEEVLMELYNIKFLKIDYVDKILIQNDYYSMLNARYKNIFFGIKSDNLSSIDYKYMIYFIENKNVSYDDINYFIHILMKRLLLNKLEISNDEKLILIKNFTEIFMKDVFSNYECCFEKLNDNVCGDYLYNRIRLDKDYVNSLLSKKKNLEVLKLIFHEYTHICQNKLLRDGVLSYFSLIQAKEEIIEKIIPSYYKENYFIVNKETHARCCESQLALQYLDIQKISLDHNERETLISDIKKEEQLMLIQSRVLNDKEITVDELFLSFDVDAKMLNKYPVLNIEFKVEDNRIVKKSIEEIIDDYNNYKNGTLKLNGMDDDINFLYNYLIENIKKNKERS